jgi:hypothetical protein
LAENSSLHPALFWSIWIACREACDTLKIQGYVFVKTPKDTSTFHREHNGISERTIASDVGWNFALNILCQSPETIHMLESQWMKTDRWAIMTNGVYAHVSGIVYATARISILILALSALRKQDERLYTDTWGWF